LSRQKKTVSGSQLDKDLDDYFKQDPKFTAKKLDTDMEEYWSQKPNEENQEEDT